MYNTILITHKIAVTLFLLIYFIKTILLLTNKNEQLAKFVKLFRIPEMIISLLFLATGIYLLAQMPEINKLMVFKLLAVVASIPIAIIGFKKSNKGLATLSLALIVGAYGLAEVIHKQMTHPKLEVAAQTDVKEIYTQLCVKCHGEDGKAGLMNATDLSLSQIDDASMDKLIKNGKNNMPSFGNQLTNEQVTTVAEYTKTLRK